MEYAVSSKDVVDRRFRKVSLDNPVSEQLYKLALRKEENRSFGCDYAEGMHADIPNVEQYMAIKRKVSLLPLDKVKDKIKLPSIPTVVIELQKAMNENYSSEKLADIVQNDLKLSTAIMSLVNSSLYSLPTKAETLSRAITLIGTKEISSLALGTRLMSMFEDTVPESLPLDIFWKHSIACAVIAYDLAIMCSRKDPEKYIMAGLLHDLGRVMLFSRYPDVSKVALALQQEKDMTLHDAELWLFDVDHCMIGGLFLGEWDLPMSIVQSALYHHTPDKCLGKDVPEIIYVANQIATALGIGCNRFYDMASGQDIWEKLNLDLQELQNMVDGVDVRLKAMFCSMFPDSSMCQV